MSFVIDPNRALIATSNDKIIGVGTHVFETNMPAGATWTAGLTVTVEIQSPYPGDETQWEVLHTFSDKGSFRVDLIEDRTYRVVASSSGPWVYLNTVRERWTK